jgi:DNA-binding NarL/FixJ family response regulator
VSVRVLVVDDQTLVRTGLSAILSTEDGIDVVGEAADGAEAVELARRLRPDVVLMDIRMPVLDGVAATRQLAAEPEPGPRVLILTTFDLDELVHAALEAGASGFLLKDSPPDELVRGIRVVAAGEALLAPSVTRRLIAHVTGLRTTSGTSQVAREAVARLTDRERDVLRLIARGLSNVEIAQSMYVTESTVKTHVGRIFTKLAVRERVQAAVTAYDAGLVVPGTD